MMSVLERFFSKVSIYNNGCWMWKGAKVSHRYGAFHYVHDGHRESRAHRIAWILFIGDIPRNVYVLHKCDNGFCVNPMHLFLGDQRDNLLDCAKKGRIGRKLNKEQVRSIRDETSIGCRRLAKIYNVDSSNIRAIRKRRSWTHI